MKYPEVVELGLHNPIVHAWLTVQRRDQLTDEETLLQLVLALANAQAALLNEHLEALRLTPRGPYILPAKDVKEK